MVENGILNVPEYKECEFRKMMVKKLIENMDKISSDNIGFEKIDKTYVPVINE